MIKTTVRLIETIQTLQALLPRVSNLSLDILVGQHRKQVLDTKGNRSVTLGKSPSVKLIFNDHTNLRLVDYELKIASYDKICIGLLEHELEIFIQKVERRLKPVDIGKVIEYLGELYVPIDPLEATPNDLLKDLNNLPLLELPYFQELEGRLHTHFAGEEIGRMSKLLDDLVLQGSKGVVKLEVDPQAMYVGHFKYCFAYIDSDLALTNYETLEIMERLVEALGVNPC